ncbi:hypothetical protein CTZ27_13825 [Streptomyces griseocarneus]|nr:hypothetical protein CTZ27_13825 [Streptomyces griseocarneus]
MLAAVAITALLAGGGVHLITKTDSGKGAHDSTGARTGSTPPATGSTPSEPPALPSSPDNGKATNAGPHTFTGTWQSSFSSNSGANYRTITVSGSPNVDVTIDGSGLLDDGTSYSCRWHAASTIDGGTVRLGYSTVTQAAPTSACRPGSASDLTLLPDGRLRRDFTDTSTKDAGLVYRRAG